jgi:hypothetical protein
MINPEEIANIAEQEEMFWWFRGMRKIAFQLLDPIARQHKIERIFEGGWMRSAGRARLAC